MTPAAFQQNLLAWFDQYGRKELPWQQNRTPYRVWLSEIMLQQTQVVTVIPYFLAFTAKFPDVHSLAQASIDEVLPHWSGLGYYARARNLHKTARIICAQNRFPETIDELTALPGIGQSTAGAILSIAFNKSHPILDGNVKRVFARFKAISGWPGNTEVNKQLWATSAFFTPELRVADYTQAIMDLGATVCTRTKPVCSFCPLADACVAYLSNSVTNFPTPKPRIVLPVKQRIFLVLRNGNGQILLEQRPPSGIWGGLWCLPEYTTEKEVMAWCHQCSIRITSSQYGATRRHTFSHFHLDYTPLEIETDSLTYAINDSGRLVWYDFEKTEELGLATPIKLLLQHYFTGEKQCPDLSTV